MTRIYMPNPYDRKRYEAKHRRDSITDKEWRAFKIGFGLGMTVNIILGFIAASWLAWRW